MKLEKLKLVNFMRYKGTNCIQFSCDEDKNVTVVLGDNTVGKTTISQAIRFAMYGEILVDAGKKLSDYVLLNSDVIESMNSNSRETMKVELVIANEDYKYKVIRERTYTRKYPTFVVNEVYSSDKLYIAEAPDYDYIEKGEANLRKEIELMFPKDLSSYFLFDGEKWNTPNLNGIREDIKSSVHKLTGLSSTEMAMYHLKAMGRNSVINKMKGKIQGQGAIYESIAADNDRDRGLVDECKERIKIAEANMTNYEKQIKQLEEELEKNRETEQNIKNYRNIERLYHSEENNFTENRKRMFQDFSNEAYAFFAAPMIAKANEIMGCVKHDKKDIPSMRQATIDALIERGECICGAKIEKGNEAYRHLMAEREYLPPASMGIIISEYEKTAKKWEYIREEFLVKIEEDARKVQKASQSREKIYNEYRELGKILDTSYDSADTRKEMIYLQGELKKHEAEKNRLLGMIENLENTINRREQELVSQEKKNKENEKWKYRIDIANRIYDHFAEDYKKKEREVFLILNEKIKQKFDVMFNAKDKRISLDDNYNIVMEYATDNGWCEERNLSEGEKVARNFAFIAAIMEYEAQRKAVGDEDAQRLPIVLDGPFSKLGEENIGLISAQLPLMSEQVIIFTLEKDWDAARLEKYVGAKYRICKNPMEKYAAIQEEV